MRARNIKPGILRNEFFGTADPLLTILFEGLWMIADREGRLEDRPMLIKADVFPYRENVDVNGMLTVIEREGFIERYVIDNKKYIQVKNFHEHQKPHSTEKQSVIPPPLNNSEPTVNPPLDNAPDSLIHRFTDSSDCVVAGAKPPFQIIYEAGCEAFPCLATQNTSSIRQWIAAGCDAELDVVPEIQRHAKAGKSVRSWNFFTGGVMDAYATRTTAPAAGTPKTPQETTEEKTARIMREYESRAH